MKRTKKPTQSNTYFVVFQRVAPYPPHGEKAVVGLKEAWKLADRLATMPQVKGQPMVMDETKQSQVMRNGKKH